MIYSARRLGETYRIYSARSEDGLAWRRDSEPMIEVAASGWDSEMVCYGSRLDTEHGNFLLYNGNAYGKDGFGAALLRGSVLSGARTAQIKNMNNAITRQINGIRPISALAKNNSLRKTEFSVEISPSRLVKRDVTANRHKT